MSEYITNVLPEGNIFLKQIFYAAAGAREVLDIL
jgi:hypothetical protein